ncbi:hypothetical protein K7X08_035197 [Anisodus acutangulus]|uniref:Citrate transporter-like domain-containing protein n=1 Tax=Anisodus acutangulus TaxID=402998 RepID=A0A9Q1LIJ9_9SOLA|nr:hypothetical protein K7X08_035197 [Anisodus acutangulus]
MTSESGFQDGESSHEVLSVQKDVENAEIELVSDEEVVSPRFSPATMSHVVYTLHSQEQFSVDSMNTNSQNQGNFTENEIKKDANEGFDSSRNANDGSLQMRDKNVSSKSVDGCEDQNFTSYEENEIFSEKWKRLLWKICVYLVTFGLISLLMGLNISWTAITAALALVVLDFKDARACSEKVSYSLLIFFCRMFINRTGIPSAFWNFMEPYAKIDHAGGIAVLAVVIIVLSNLASNVPTGCPFKKKLVLVLLLGVRVGASAAAISATSGKKAWLILAWVSTVAGNLSLLVSAANLIVCEQARRPQPVGYNLTFWTHLKFGVPSTLIVTAIGLTLIRA